MDDKLTIFIAVTAAAVVTQMLILAVIAAILWRMSARIHALADDVQSRAMPLMDDAKKLTGDVKSLLETSRPKVDAILDNVSTISTTAREQSQKIDATLTGFMDHARLQAIRADEMLTRTFDRVEGASSKVENTVMSPLRHLNGVLQGIGAGLDTLFQKSRQPKNGRHNDEMFI
jgi:ABC-type transporter Mla subunit MlaD